MTDGLAPDGKPMVGPFDRAGWREWLIANHGSSNGVYLLSWRRGSGKASVPYDDSETLCLEKVSPSGPSNTRSTARPAGVSSVRAASCRKMPLTCTVSPGR